MRFNKLIVVNILETKFWDAIEKQVTEDIQNMDGEDFDNEFETSVDFLKLDYIEDLRVENFETEPEDEGILVFGEITVQADVNGFTYYDSEFLSAGTAMLALVYSFSFTEYEGKFDDFYLEHVD